MKTKEYLKYLNGYLCKLEKDRVNRRKNSWILKILTARDRKSEFRVFLRDIGLGFIANNETICGKY